GVQNLTADLRGRLRSRQRDDVAVGVGFDAKSALDEGEMGIIFAEQVGEQPVVVEGYDDAVLRPGSLTSALAGSLRGPFGFGRPSGRRPARSCQMWLS